MVCCNIILRSYSCLMRFRNISHAKMSFFCSVQPIYKKEPFRIVFPLFWHQTCILLKLSIIRIWVVSKGHVHSGCHKVPSQTWLSFSVYLTFKWEPSNRCLFPLPPAKSVKHLKNPWGTFDWQFLCKSLFSSWFSNSSYLDLVINFRDGVLAKLNRPNRWLNSRLQEMAAMCTII